MEITGERFFPGESGINQLEHYNRYYFVVNQVDLNRKSVLDIASGEGFGSNILAKYAQKVTGIDISIEAVRYAAEKYKSENLNFIQGDAIEIPLKDKSVDIIVSFETIEHLDKHNEMMLEIKRVLKDNGILIISSPDKYNYSELPNVKNKFHVKELYSEEFKKLINKYFKKTIYYSQRAFVCSLIVLDEKSQKYSIPIVVDNKGNSYKFNSVYNIAIATDDIGFTPTNQIILYKEFDIILTHNDIKTALEKVHNTKAYRLGKLILKPFSLIKNKLK